MRRIVITLLLLTATIAPAYAKQHVYEQAPVVVLVPIPAHTKQGVRKPVRKSPTLATNSAARKAAPFGEVSLCSPRRHEPRRSVELIEGSKRRNIDLDRDVWRPKVPNATVPLYHYRIMPIPRFEYGDNERRDVEVP